VGRDVDSGRPVFVPPPRSLVTLIGAAGAGKTTRAITLVEGLVDHGASLTVLDAKGSRALARRCLELAERHERRFALVSLEPFGDERLDRRRVPWNVVGCGNPTEVKDTIMSSEDFSEPYYRTTGERGVLAAAGCLAAEGERPNAATLAALLQDPDALAARLDHLDRSRFAAEAAWILDLTKGELSALRGIASKLARLIQSEGGEQLVPDGGPELDLEVAMRTGAIVLFSLPASAYPEHAPQLSRYLTQQVNAVCGRITRGGRPGRAVFWIDDASGLAAGQLPALYERAREAGVVVMTAVQSLSNLTTLGGERLHAAALEDAELVAVLRQSLPGAASELAELAGAKEAYEHAHEVGGTNGWLGHSDETGRRTRRLVEQPIVSPEAIKRLRTGEAVLISRREGLTTKRIRIEQAAS
ncbi:MAG: type IV secretory system conjugative DNA transfer family protein, partial [Solirubrobacterales bacterium]